jgi:hypothetical protein
LVDTFPQKAGDVANLRKGGGGAAVALTNPVKPKIDRLLVDWS